MSRRRMLALLAALVLSAAAADSTLAGVITSAVGDFSNAVNTETSEWSYRYANDLVRDGAYQLLPTHSDATPLWNPSNPFWNNGNGSVPGVGVNQSGAAIAISGGFQPFSWPADTVWMHPGNLGLTVVSWLSPVTGLADVQFEFSDMDPNTGGSGTTGVHWFVDVNDSSGHLANGSFTNGATSGPISIMSVPVTAGDRINFIVDPLGDFGFDSTTFTATIEYTPEPSALSLLMVMGLGALRRR